MVARAVVGASLIYGNRIACKIGNPIVLSYYTTKEINRFIWYNELRTMKASGYTSPMEYGRLKCWELNNWRGEVLWIRKKKFILCMDFIMEIKTII